MVACAFQLLKQLLAANDEHVDYQHQFFGAGQRGLTLGPSRFSARLILIASAILWAGCADAHDPQRPELDQWFRGLTSASGGSCCDGGDGSKAEAEWDVKGNHYRVRDPKGEWQKVPDGALVKGPNLAGYAMVWWYHINGVPFIRCFIAGPLF